MLKEDDEIDNVWQVYLMDNQKKYLGAVSLEDLIIFEHNLKFSDIPIEKHISFSINHKADIKDAVEIVTNYNLNAIAVVMIAGDLSGVLPRMISMILSKRLQQNRSLTLQVSMMRSNRMKIFLRSVKVGQCGLLSILLRQ